MEKSDVVQAYQWLLGRTPETTAIVDEIAKSRSSENLRHEMLSSTEFRELYTTKYLGIYKFVFVRIPKAATSSLSQAIVDSTLKHVSFHSDQQDLHALIRSNDVISGHVGYGDIVPKLHGLRPIFISVVREPLSRTVSLYRQALDEDNHPCREDVLGRTLYEALEREGIFYEWVYNSQCKFLSNTLSFERTKQVLEEELYIVASMYEL